MAGKTVIAIGVALLFSAVSGVALGQFAITQPHADRQSFAIADRTGNPDAAYGPSSAVLAQSADLNEGAPTAPVCKGCGPTLAQRRASAYFGDGYKPFEESATPDYEYAEDPAQATPDTPDSVPPPMSVTISE